MGHTARRRFQSLPNSTLSVMSRYHRRTRHLAHLSLFPPVVQSDTVGPGKYKEITFDMGLSGAIRCKFGKTGGFLTWTKKKMTIKVKPSETNA
jgi:hypothetical protein